MRRMVITFLLCAMMSTWALNTVVPGTISTSNSGGDIVITADPHPDDEWD